MAVLGKQHSNLKMDELAAGVGQYMDDEATKEDIEKLEPNATEKGTYSPRAALTYVAEVSIPLGATGETPSLLRWTSQRKWLSLLTCRPLDCTLCCKFLFGTLYVKTSSFLQLLAN